MLLRTSNPLVVEVLRRIAPLAVPRLPVASSRHGSPDTRTLTRRLPASARRGTLGGVPTDTPSEIVPGLWMSGSRAALAEGRFDRVLTLCAERNEHVAVPSGSVALAWRIPDAQLDEPEGVRAWARRISAWIDEGETVLVRCAAGLNRSGLVIARTLIERGMAPHDAVMLVRERRRADALNNPWFVDWLRHEPPGFTADTRIARHIPLPRTVVGWQPFTRRVGLDDGELVSSAIAAAVSGGLYLRFGHAYLARGVVGDLVGFGVLALPVVAHRARLRHEAMVCLAGIGVVHAREPEWPLQVGSSGWWAAFGAGLAGYLLVRWRQLPSSRWAARRERRRLTAAGH
jgi:hypothetical protein